MYQTRIKRLLDITLSLLLLPVSLPLMLAASVAIIFDSGFPVLFKQKRLGYRGRVFMMYKFRSMAVGAEHTGSGVYSDKNDARVTKVGAVLRATSIDELPQLFNILKGDMSLIGPRPPLTYHPWRFEEYTDEQKKMFSVRPGITGWAQVHGRRTVEWDERIRMNVWYATHLTFFLDLKILMMTIGKVLTNADNENRGETVSRN